MKENSFRANTEVRSSVWSILQKSLMLFSFLIFIIGQFAVAQITSSKSQYLSTLNDGGNLPVNSSKVNSATNSQVTVSSAAMTFAPMGMPAVITQSNNNSLIENGSGLGCGNGTSHFYRYFDLPTDFGITNDFVVTSVEFGIQEFANPGDNTFTVNIYSTTPGDFPNVVFNLEGTANYESDGTEYLEIVSIPLSATIPAGNAMIIEIYSTSTFWIGGNTYGEIADSYILSIDCNVSNIVSFSSVGFPDSNIVCNIFGEEEEPQSDDNIWENGSWSKGVPINTNLPHRKLIFRSDFDSETNVNTNKFGRIWGTSAVVEAGVSVVFNSENSMVLEDELIVDSDNGASATFKSGASLGQKNPNAVNQGIVDFERNFNISESGDQYNLVISPVLDFDIQNVYPGSPLVYKLDESTNGFVNDGVGAYVPGKGFRLDEAGSAGSLTGVFTGIPANGNFNFPVTANGSGMNLTGNPYPSILLLDRFYASNLSKITPSFYFWDNRGYTNQNSVLYHVAVYNAASQTGTAAMGPVFAGYEQRIPNGEVSVANGFAVQATQAGMLKFRNTQRLKVDSDEPEFFGKSAAKDRYWLTMTTPDNMQAMTAVVYFGEGNNGVGIEDSKSVFENDIIYSLVNDNQLVIQGKAPFSSSDVVSMGVKVTTNGKHTIALLKQEGVFENGQNIFLKDKVTGAVHNLSQGAYQFNATVGQYNDRFEIIYNGFTDLMATANGISIEKKNQNIEVSTTGKNITNIEIFDLTGQPVYSKSGLNTQFYSVPVSLMKNQIVVVSVKTDTGEIVNKKFVNQ